MQVSSFAYAESPAPPSLSHGLSELDDVLRRRSRGFVHGALFTALILQRFGLNFGSSVLFASLPVFALLVVWMLLQGQARIRREALALYAIVAVSFLISAQWAIVFPDPRVENSLPSLVALLFTYALLTVEPNERFDASQTMDVFLGYARVLAALGIAQFLLQFVGLGLFAFGPALPFLKPVLVEHIFAFNPLLSYRSTIVRSNGFFLVEPATFSQLLVMAASIEFFLFHHLKWLPLYLVAYLVSYSGTGFLGLSVALCFYCFTSIRSMRRTLAFALAGVATVGLVALAVPSVFEVFARRAHELESTGSSGYARYVAQFGVMGHFISEARCLIGYGPGALERSIYYVEGAASPAVKLLIDYGVIGLLLFALFLPTVVVRKLNLIVPILFLVTFQLGGGHLLFTPFIVLMTVLCVWSRPPDESATPS